MRKVFLVILVVITGLFFISLPASVKVPVESIKATPGLKTQSGVNPSIQFGTMPLYFVCNKGQENAEAKYYAKASGYTLWLTTEGLVFDSFRKNGTDEKPLLQREVSRLMFDGANKKPQIIPVDIARAKVNIFKGRDKSKWLGNIPTSKGVLYKNLYTHIDLKVYGIEKKIEYDWVVKKGGDPSVITFHYDYVKGSRIDKEGNLLITTRFGDLVHKRPVSFQEIDNKKVPVDVTFKHIKGNTYGFNVPQYNRDYPLIIDPVVMAYSTCLGGDADDWGQHIAVSADGLTYATGTTLSAAYPVVDEYMAEPGDGDDDVVISIVDTTQSGNDSLLYSTYLGGDGMDRGQCIDVDSNGMVHVAGYTESDNFPLLNEYQGVFTESETVVVSKLDPTAGAAGLLYSTYLNGSSNDRGYGIAVDSSGYTYVTGSTESDDFPTLNEYQSDPGDGSHDVFVSKLDTTLSGAASLLYSTYLAGSGMDMGFAITVGSGGIAYVTGSTQSNDFPTLNEYQSAPGGGSEQVFVSKLDTTQSGASCLLYSTYLGSADDDSIGNAIALDTEGNVYVVGSTDTPAFPVVGEYMSDPGDGETDAFIAKLDTEQSGSNSLLSSTYLGGDGNDEGNGIAVDSNNYVYVTGNTESTDFPTSNEYLSAPGAGDQDIFITKLDSDLGSDSIYYSTYLGGSNRDVGNGIGVDASGNAYVVGQTLSADYPVNNEYSAFDGDSDLVVTKISPVVATVTTDAVSSILATSAQCGGDVTSHGGAAVTTRGLCWSTTANPTTSDSTVTSGSGTGTFSGNLTGLTGNTLYYVRAYAVNSAGTAYGNEVSFTSGITIPTVTTDAVSNIGFTTADCGGEVTANGGSAITGRGLCWSTATNPTTSDNSISIGLGIGTFSGTLTGLTGNTLYYVRAYAVNSAGTAYGNEVSFTAGGNVPTVTTDAASNIGLYTADCGGEVTANGGFGIISRGLCWSTTTNPTTSDNSISIGLGTGSFTGPLTGLTSGTTYYVRAYASNLMGMAYGNEVSFTTSVLALATVTTYDVTNIGITTADFSGEVTDEGSSEVTSRGLCWNTAGSPTTAGDMETLGSGIGTFSSSNTSLTENTTYYVRAFAINSVGTAYGNETSFTTLAESISVTITEPEDGDTVSGNVAIHATTSSVSQDPTLSTIMATSKVEFYIDDEKIAEDSTAPYETAWDTSSYSNGSYTIKAVAYNTANETAQDEITVYLSNVPPELMINRIRLNYGSVPQDSASAAAPLNNDSPHFTTSSQIIYVNNIGGGVLNWSATVSDEASWVSCTPVSGMDSGSVSVSVDVSGLAVGSYSSSVTIQAPGAINSPQTVPIYLTIHEAGSTTIPFGFFETPQEGSTVSSSVPVTGWVLDDIDIQSVKIYRMPVPGHETKLMYVGEAVMVDGARPDVEQTFPAYPKTYQAGWGYMLLTNYLPFNGNGTFTLVAKAVDAEGNELTLGSKTITADNTNVVKPFGAIDTPSKGGTALGETYTNFGWALTPQPNSIPTDGSTIMVWVDGLSIGHPIYNQYREDVATRFPGYANSDGAFGYLNFDTTKYLNGIHTISWSVEDNAGNVDGAGSRYFAINNTGTKRVPSTAASSVSTLTGSVISPRIGRAQIRTAALSQSPLKVKKGYTGNKVGETIKPNVNGVIRIDSKEMERLEVRLGNALPPTGTVTGYLLQGNRLMPLPVGSTLDSKGNIFYWQPCAGFHGLYRFVFATKDAKGGITRKLVNVNIATKY
ncbi:MAG: hypothetical protein GY757_02615 [bacterium]|nr:hypothetical protein [bacterium]